MTEPRTAAGRALARYRTMNDGELDGYILAIEAEARAAALEEARAAVEGLRDVEAIEDRHVGIRYRAMADVLAAIDAMREEKK